MNQFSNTDAPRLPQRVRISWELLTPADDSGDRPDENDDGFWPSLEPDACGYIGDAAPDDVDGVAHQAEYERQLEAAEARMAAWEADGWHYVGVVARARVFIPIGGGSFRVMTLDSGGLWGIESDAGDYLREVFGQERENLLAELRTLGAALGTSPDFDEELPE
jgi:hypothetical protein